MGNLLRGGIIGAAVAVGLSISVLLIEAKVLNLALANAEPWRLLRHGWGELETFYGLGMVIGFIIGSLWAGVAIRGQRPGTPTAAISANRTLRNISLGIVLLLAIAATSLVITPVRFAAVGWCRGENFYRGLPVSYWLGELKSACQPVKVNPDEAGLVAIFGGLAVEELMQIVGQEIKKDAVPGLVEMLNDPNPTARRVAAATLYRIGPEAAEATPALIEVLKHDKESKVRLNAALALVEIGPGAKNAVPTLIESLRDKELLWSAQQRVCEALAKMGPEAKAAIPTLIELTNKEGEIVRFLAFEALKKIDPEAAEKHAPK